MPKAINYLINVLFLICFFICAVLSRSKLVIIFYLQAIFNTNYDAFQLQRGSLYLLIIRAVNVTQCRGEIRMFYIFFITIDEGF